MAGTQWIHESPKMEINQKSVSNTKCIHDPVHGPIELDPILVAIVDTPQFQRLRNIMQLGGVHWVYPGASHTRFEHSIGTAFLCGLMIESLQSLHGPLSGDYVEISAKDVLCVKIAGLCHDLGHGPYSHLFDKFYIPHVREQQIESGEVPIGDWKHEEASVAMFQYMLEDEKNCKLRDILKEENFGKNEIEFIKDLIRGRDPNKEDTIPAEFEQVCNYRGEQSVAKWFIYEIVANKRNGIDCDKFDYLLRDSHYLGMNTNFDYRRYFQQIRIMQVDGILQLCVRDKEIFDLYMLFYTRWSLHHRVYLHKTTVAVEKMLVEALSKVDKDYGISKSINDMSQFMNISDFLMYRILADKNDGTDAATKTRIDEAKSLLERIQRRDLYRLSGQIPVRADYNLPTSQQEIVSEIADIILEEKDIDIEAIKNGNSTVTNEPKCPLVKACYWKWKQSKDQTIGSLEIDKMAMINLSKSVTKADLILDITTINFGMKDQNPVASVQAYGKDGIPYSLEVDHISEMLPKCFQEKYIRIYVRDSNKEQIATAKLTSWCKNKGFVIPRDLEESGVGYITPGGRSEKHNQRKRPDIPASSERRKRLKLEKIPK